uniref:SHSP domain-containing protein n=1 Tax=Lactuca sativa TaxID=4236 RepID=A0A9R1XNB3_LACSA|nr:hypothetical protein LSAT_V11C200050710 [Lactuca sativa]
MCTWCTADSWWMSETPTDKDTIQQKQDDPFQGLSSALCNLPEPSHETEAIANARIDRKEMPGAHIFKADLPGLKKEEVEVEVEEGRLLQISEERSKEHEEKNDKWHRVERSSGKF